MIERSTTFSGEMTLQSGR